MENGLSIVENQKRHGKSYNRWLSDRTKPSHRELLCAAIDTTLAQKPADFDTLLKFLQKTGYEVKPGKVPALRSKDQKRFVRLNTLGSGYGEMELRAVLSGKKAHKSRNKIIRPAPEKQVNCW